MNDIKFNFAGKSVVITGAATGIGRETAIQFAKAGANVAVWDFNEAKGQETVNECKAQGVKSIFCKVDVRDIAQIEAARDTVLKEFGTVDVVFSNAGVGAANGVAGPPLESIPDTEWDRVFDINLFGTIKVCRAFLNVFREKKAGKIIMTASIAAFQSGSLMPQYNSSKIATINFMQSLAVEMGPYNVNVNAVCPGFVYTPIYSEGGAMNIKNARAAAFQDLDDSEAIMKRLAAGSAMGRPQTAEDIANAVMFLSSSAAKEITGQSILVDSGLIRR